MKKILIALCSIVLFAAACKEKAPPIDFSGNRTLVDTTYVVSPVPATDPHNVLVEEFTGQTCPNCPAAHDLLRALPNQDRLNIICLYMWGMNQTIPPAGAKYDFRDKDSIASKISAAIYSGGPSSGIPCAGFDRVPVGGVMHQYTPQWSNSYNQQLAVTDSLNLSLTSAYDTTDSVTLITTMVTYTKQVTTKQNITIVIVEDSMIDKQEIPMGEEEHYLFTNVYRDAVTSMPHGDPLIPAVVVKEAGRVNKRSYLYKLKPGWDPKHCRIVAFVHYSNSENRKDIMQSVQTKL